MRLDLNLHKEYFQIKDKNKELAAKNQDLESYEAKCFDMDVSVFEPYNFIYDQRKTNVYKSTFFQYVNYEPLHDILKRWSIYIDEKEIQDIKSNIG
jgi:hypothetical protein